MNAVELAMLGALEAQLRWTAHVYGERRCLRCHSAYGGHKSARTLSELRKRTCPTGRRYLFAGWVIREIDGHIFSEARE